MGISIQARNDYSYLFSGLNTSSGGSGVGNLNFLSDYAAIKNGSYGKLMKAYYAEANGTSTKSSGISSIVNKTNSISKDDTKTLAKVESTTEGLKESADKLLEKGSKSVWAEEDMEKIYSAVSDLVKDYNSVLDTMDDVNSTSILSRAKNLTQNTAINEKLLAKAGVTINEDNSLAIDKKAFMEADMSAVKNLFTGNGSFTYRVSTYASFMNYAAEQEADKAATYTGNGTYGNTFSTGSLFDSLF